MHRTLIIPVKNRRNIFRDRQHHGCLQIFVLIIPSNEVRRDIGNASVRPYVRPSVRLSVRPSVRAITQIPLARFCSYFIHMCTMGVEVLLESRFSKWPLVSKWRPFQCRFYSYLGTVYKTVIAMCFKCKKAIQDINKARHVDI